MFKFLACLPSEERGLGSESQRNHKNFFQCASSSVILLKLPSLMKQLLWRFSSRRIRIRHDNWDGIIFGTLCSILTQLLFLPNRTNSINYPTKTPSTVETYSFYCYMQFFVISCSSAHLNVLYGKSWLTILLCGSWNMFQTFLLADLLSDSARTLI